MAEKSPGLLYEQYMGGDLDDEEKQMVDASFNTGFDELNRMLTNLRGKKDISVDMALMKMVSVGSVFLFKRGMGNALLQSLADLYKKVGKDQQDITGSA